MTVRQAAYDAKAIPVAMQGATGEPSADDFYQVAGQIGEIPHGNVLDLSVLPEGASKQMGDVSLTVVVFLDCGYVDSSFFLAHAYRFNHDGKIAQPHQWGILVATKRKVVWTKSSITHGLQANFGW